MKRENFEGNKKQVTIELLNELKQVEDIIAGIGHMAITINALFQSTPLNTVRISKDKILPVLNELKKELEEKLEQI